MARVGVPCLVSALCVVAGTRDPGAARAVEKVHVLRVPNGGIQPQVVVDGGAIVHLVYFDGDPEHGDLYYLRSADFGTTFSQPMRVNRDRGSAIAIGNVRGAHLAVGKNGRVHVVWNGTHALPDEPGPPRSNRLPMLYTRLNAAGTAFEPERNLIHSAYGIDGGGALAADRSGRVYVFWHAPVPGLQGEEHRRVWITRSSDDGETFDHERPALEDPTGACGCCGMGALADGRDTVYALFRSATEKVHRDIYLLASTDHGERFQGADVAPWNVGACVMSTENMIDTPRGVLAAWETTGQVYFGAIDPQTRTIAAVSHPSGEAVPRKHPVLARNRQGEVLLAWTEGMGWRKGGTLAWQIFDASGAQKTDSNRVTGVPMWSLVAAFARPDGTFVILY